MAAWPIFVLTLKGDDERRAPLLRQLSDAGLDYQLFFGVDGRAGLPPEAEKLVDRDAAAARLGRPMTDGELACALSHRAICSRILDEGLPGAIVFEDDARLVDGFADLFRAGVHRNVPLLLLHYRFGRAVRLLSRRATSGVVLRRAASQATSAMAYAVRADAAAAALPHMTPVRYQADWPFDLHDFGTWLTVPRLAHVAPETISHLESERGGREAKATRPKPKQGLRRWLRQRMSVRVDRERGQI